MGAQGTADLNFGVFPGASDASVSVTGQAAIVSGSLVEAWLRPEATVDHTADEHMVETINVFAHTIVAGTGFSISGFNTSQQNEPVTPSIEQENWTSAGTGTLVVNRIEKSASRRQGAGGMGTRLYGIYKVGWVWN